MAVNKASLRTEFNDSLKLTMKNLKETENFMQEELLKKKDASADDCVDEKLTKTSGYAKFSKWKTNAEDLDGINRDELEDDDEDDELHFSDDEDEDDNSGFSENHAYVDSSTVKSENKEKMLTTRNIGILQKFELTEKDLESFVQELSQFDSDILSVQLFAESSRPNSKEAMWNAITKDSTSESHDWSDLSGNGLLPFIQACLQDLRFKHIILWVGDKTEKEFEIVDLSRLAEMWGREKKKDMTKRKLNRSLNYLTKTKKNLIRTSTAKYTYKIAAGEIKPILPTDDFDSSSDINSTTCSTPVESNLVGVKDLMDLNEEEAATKTLMTKMKMKKMKIFMNTSVAIGNGFNDPMLKPHLNSKNNRKRSQCNDINNNCATPDLTSSMSNNDSEESPFCIIPTKRQKLEEFSFTKSIAPILNKYKKESSEASTINWLSQNTFCHTSATIPDSQSVPAFPGDFSPDTRGSYSPSLNSPSGSYTDRNSVFSENLNGVASALKSSILNTDLIQTFQSQNTYTNVAEFDSISLDVNAEIFAQSNKEQNMNDIVDAYLSF